MRVRTRLGLLLCLLACSGCGQKSTDQLIQDVKAPQERDQIIAVRLLPERKGDAAKVSPALIKLTCVLYEPGNASTPVAVTVSKKAYW